VRRALAALGVLGLALGSVLFVPDAGAQVPPTTTTTIDPNAAAARAAAGWSPPTPRIRTNPPPGRAQVAGLATWLWVEPPGPVAFTTPEGLAMQARAASVRFDFGDGATLTCAGTGTPYDPSRPESAQSSECTHAWKATSAGQTLPVDATVTWTVYFEGRAVATRQASGDVDLAVAEAQALDRRPDPMSGAEAAAGAEVDAAQDGGRPLGELGGLVPETDDRPWWKRTLRAVGGFLSDAPGRAWGGLKDLGAGIWDGVAGPLASIWEFSNLRALLDWDGYKASWSRVWDAVSSDPWRFTKETLKGLVGWQDFADGKPLKAIGSWVPGLVLAFFTGGGSLAAKGAQGAAKGTTAVKGLDDLGDASRAAKATETATAAKLAEEAILRTPRVASQKLQNIVNDLYKGTTNPGRVGTGTTADAIRYELRTGERVFGRSHIQKGEDYLRALEKWLSENPTAPYHDRLVARSLADDLLDALGKTT